MQTVVSKIEQQIEIKLNGRKETKQNIIIKIYGIKTIKAIGEE